MVDLLQQGIRQAQAGRRADAIALLAQHLREHPTDVPTWLWLARVVEADADKLFCLEQVQRIEPQNQTARRGVQALGKRLAPRPLVSVPLAPPVAEPIRPDWAGFASVETAARGRDRRGRPGWGLVLLAGRRLAFGALILLTIILLTYLGLDMAGGTPFGPAASQALSRTGAYLTNLVQGDLGLSTAGGETLLAVPVLGVIRERLPRSLGLLGVSLLLAALVGVSLGVLAARSKAQRSLYVLIATIIGMSVPSFFAAYLLQWAVITLTRHAGRALLPVGGFGWDNHLLLPALVLSARPVAQITRMTFIAVRQVLDQDYVRTARSKGLRRHRVLAVHVLRNAAIPILTTIGVSLRFSLSSLPVVELYFGWPGAGFTLLKSIARHDHNLTVALVLCLGSLFILVNLILELCYRILDPRLSEGPAHVALRERRGLVATLRDARDELRDWADDNLLVRWRRKRQARQAAELRPEELADRSFPRPNQTVWETRTRSAWKSALTNLPFMVGGLVVLGLALLVFVGPSITPNNPYRTEGLVFIDGKLALPPFEPGEAYPWGTDMLGRCMMSLLLAGAQQTLILAALAVATRTVVGVVLGALAGWTHGGQLDRWILGAAEIISAFPTLLLAMILILALDIRQGMVPFVLALCFVGWGEIMQFVRGEVIKLRPQPYIESAVATGARTARILGRHILPNLFSALISIIALEMGAVLMTLGELGFISIFIGGGTLFHLPAGVALYSDVPEWGALLANIRYQARSYPWTALYPMLAFFVSILSFNLFGEGLRRLVEEGNLVINRLVSWYTVAATVVAALVLSWLMDNSGSTPYYRAYAQQFEADRAMQHVLALTAPEMEGRALGTVGVAAAAKYIAEEFQDLGLQSGGQRGTWFQDRTRSFGYLVAEPELVIHDDGPPVSFLKDIAAYSGSWVSLGVGSGPVKLIALGVPLVQATGIIQTRFVDLAKVDFDGQVILTLDAQDALEVARRVDQGLLVVAPDEHQFEIQPSLSGASAAAFFHWFNSEPIGQDYPSLWLSNSAAERLLDGSGYTLSQVRDQRERLAAEEVWQLDLVPTVDVEVQAQIEERFPVQNVIGYIPGSVSFDNCVDCLARYLVVVMAPYDSPPPVPGKSLSAANDNASGVAVILEAIRVLQESGYQANRSIMFIAYAGQGREGGELVSYTDVSKFLQARPAFSNFKLEAVIHVRGVGAGTGDGLEVTAGSSLRLAELLEKSAQQMGVSTARAREAIDISMIYDQGRTFTRSGQEAPMVSVRWQGWEGFSQQPADSVEAISEDKLAGAGRTLAMALMVLGRELGY
jgi:ABC-type dipeptide/oligopeptide/nickel transport system permease component